MEQIGLGESMALGCALTWAIGVILMKRCSHQISPLVLNIFKIGMATVLFIPTIYFFDEPLSVLSNYTDVLILAASGIVGIGIADTLWLTALKKTDASTIAIIDCMYSPSVVGLSFVFLGEVLSWMQLIGGMVVVFSLLLVTLYGKNQKSIFQANHEGVVYGLSAVILMAIGIVLSKPVLDNFPLIISIEVRLVAGLIFLLAQAAISKKGLKQIKEVLYVENKISLFVGSFFAAYLAMIFWMGGTKYTDASIAAVLNQTSTFFIILMAWLFLKEKISRIKIIGCILGFSGCLFLIY